MPGVSRPTGLTQQDRPVPGCCPWSCHRVPTLGPLYIEVDRMIPRKSPYAVHRRPWQASHGVQDLDLSSDGRRHGITSPIMMVAVAQEAAAYWAKDHEPRWVPATDQAFPEP